MPNVSRAQKPTSLTDLDAACVKVDDDALNATLADKKVKKKKQPKEKLVPLSLVVCEVEKALDAYQQSPEVADGTQKEYFHTSCRQILISRRS